jgi:alanine racemase
MQSAFVEIGPTDQRGDEVILLGTESEIDTAAIAKAWGSSQQEVLVRLTKLSQREYSDG